MDKVKKKVSKKEKKSNILNENINFKNLNFSKLLAISIIGILVISLGVSIFYEFKDKKGGKLTDSESQITSAIEYDCNYVWFQQIINKATREIIWICNSARPYCKAGTPQCCKWTNATGHYDCYDMKNQQVLQNNTTTPNPNPNPNPEDSGCLDSDNGKEIWTKGNCNGNYDYCTQNFGKELHEYYCNNNDACTQETIDCTNYSARCYDGRCVRTNQDTDGDGFFDLDEYEAGTDPNNPTSNPGTQQPETFLWYCCKTGSNYGCFKSPASEPCPTNWSVLPLGPYSVANTCSANCHAPSTMEYDCNYTWYQQIVNKANITQVIWTCNYNRPFCKAGTPQCCKWTQATGHYDCYDMLLNQIVPVVTVFCTNMCDTLGYKSGRSVPDLNQCTASESKKQQGDQYCCCSGPPQNAQECSAAATKFGATAGIWPVATNDDCFTQTVAYCASIGKQPVIWAVIELSQCCLASCGGPPT